MFELSPNRTANPQAKVARGTQQSRRLLLALILLLVALAAVLVHDRQFWFGTNSTIVDDVPAGSVPSQTPAQTATVQKPAVAVTHAAKRQVSTLTPSVETKVEETPAVITKRTALPPLDVEVIAGAKHKVVRPGSNSTKLEIADANASEPAEPATNAAQREPVAEATTPTYPPLAQHMNVQGSVVLQALIAADGNIENLRVMSGPAILAAAAQQAVREWHFKPIVQNGQRVESKALITVNFTIKVADNSANPTIAESRTSDALIITR